MSSCPTRMASTNHSLDSNHLNTEIHDDKRYVNKLYTISTPWALNRVTTITKYIRNGDSASPEMMAIIEWRRFGGDTIRFQGRVIEADKFIEKRAFQSGRYFVGPDDRTYKWKTESNCCWLKAEDDDVELVRFHKKNYGIVKEWHPSFLDVSSKVTPDMLDYIILTYVYVETLRQDQVKRVSNTISNNVNTVTSITSNITNTVIQNVQSATK